MTEAVGPALEQALAYHRAPGMLPAAHGRPLPEGMITLLRLAGGDQSLTTQCAQSFGVTESEVVAAAVFFIQQVMFANGADSYRVLGVNPDAPDPRIREHYRWLVRWLHPDRNTDEWDSVYADRVNVAWQVLRLPDRRREYDLARPEPVPAAHDFRRPRGVPARVAMPEPALLSPSTVQRLPLLVLGGLGGLAVLVLFLVWLGADQRVRWDGRVLATAPVEPPAALDLQAQLVRGAAEAGASSAPNEMPMAASAPLELPAQAVAQPAVAASSPVAAAVEAAPPALEPSGQVSTAPQPLSSAGDSAPPPSPAPGARSRPGSPRPFVAPAARPDEAAGLSVPAIAPSSVPPSGGPGPLLREAQAHQLAREFGIAYQNGDINALMALFTADARNNRGGRDAIVYDYQSLFSGTESRQLQLTPTGWILREGGGTLLANYRARVRPSGRLRAEVSEGTIRFDLRAVDGRARISLVRHNDGA